MLRMVVAAAGLLFGILPASAQEQSYPSRQVELVVPFPAGGGADVGARMPRSSVSAPIPRPSWR